ncbi:MAG: MFS transporter [Bifidobacteriaceae bacterium]|nr:MFS transporter [Bifidobacteriaceae bacterium]
MPDGQVATTEKAVKKPSARLTISLIIGPACWLMPHQGVMATLLPQRLNDLAPQNKVSLLVAFSTVAMVIALISNIVLGALSDATRSCFGKRKPWIVGCSLLSCVVLVAFAYAGSVGALFAWWCVYEIVVNGVASAMVAQMSDRVPMRWRGTVSSAYSMGQTAGVQLGVLIAAQFLSNVRLGIVVFALIALTGGLVSAALAGEGSNIDEPRSSQSPVRAFAASLKFPTHGAADFYRVLAARFLQITATSLSSSYMLYIIQDYLHMGTDSAQWLLSANAIIMLVAGLVLSAVIGPIADRIRKIRVMAGSATLMIAVGAIIPAVMPTPVGLIAFSVVAGVAGGANSTLSQALSLEVLPNPAAAAKDLGILNLANTLGGVTASAVGAVLIGMWGYATVFVGETVFLVISAICIFSVTRRNV